MKYCTNCGRQLADDEVCTCRQQAQPQTPNQTQDNNAQADNAAQQAQFNGQPQGSAQGQFNGQPQGSAQGQFNGQPQGSAQGQFNGQPQGSAQSQAFDNFTQQVSASYRHAAESVCANVTFLSFCTAFNTTRMTAARMSTLTASPTIILENSTEKVRLK